MNPQHPEDFEFLDHLLRAVKGLGTALEKWIERKKRRASPAHD